mgnify:CR=1 FL=1
MRALRRRRVLRNVALGALALVIVSGLTGTFLFRGSLPVLEGERKLEGLKGSVTIERDENGVATVRGTDRLDVARATGFLRDGDNVFHSYSTYARGVDGLWGMYQWLDRAPRGRNETGVWWRRHDEYAEA